MHEVFIKYHLHKTTDRKAYDVILCYYFLKIVKSYLRQMNENIFGN